MKKENLFKKLPFYNISKNKGRSLGILALIFCLSFSLFLAAYISLSMKNGLDSTRARLGADIIVMPVDAESKIEGALLSGQPNSFYFEKDLTEEVRKMEGVEKASPQVYVASLSAECCSLPVQVIGIDFKTDFSVRPWLKNKVEGLGEKEVLAGANLSTPKGSSISLFDTDYIVKERLDKTGMGFDNCVFIDIETARKMAEDAKDKGITYPTDTNNLVSNIMVDRNDDISANEVLFTIQSSTSVPVKVSSTDTLITSIGKQMSSSANYLKILLAIVWILSILVLLIIFPLITKARTGELATLRVLGATKKNISAILLKEIGSLSVIGSVVGLIFGLLVANLFSTAIKLKLDLPFLAPDLLEQVIIAILTLLICSIIGPLSSLITINNLNKKEIALVYSEEN